MSLVTASSPPLKILEGPYLRDLLAQPEAIAESVRRLEVSASLARISAELRAGEIDRIVLTGMGSSLHALYPLQLALINAGHLAVAVETAELVHAQIALLTPSTLLVVVSQSGRSAEIVRLLERLVERRRKHLGPPRVIGVTNSVDSPLAQKCETVVLLRAGEEFSVSCKTYLATLAALHWLGVVLDNGDESAARSTLLDGADEVARYLAEWTSLLSQVPSAISGANHLFLTGRGASLAAVSTGALILKESVRIHAEGMSSPAFRHGPLEMIRSDVAVVIFAGDPATAALNEQLAKDIRAAGGHATLISEHEPAGVFRLAAGPAEIRPLLEMLPLQMISLALAVKQQREPGRFERASKITLPD